MGISVSLIDPLVLFHYFRDFLSAGLSLLFEFCSHTPALRYYRWLRLLGHWEDCSHFAENLDTEARPNVVDSILRWDP